MSQAILRARRQNADKPAVRAPPEVLTEIFKLVAANTSATQRPRRWLRVTHVCHQWREVALQAPYLWTNIVVGRKLEYTKAALHRSNGALLTVRVPYLSRPQHGGGSRLIFEHAPSIRHLDVDISPWTTFRVFNCYADELRTLIMRPAPKTLGYVPGSPVNSLSMPNLKRLELRGFELPWSHARLLKCATLTHLCVSSEQSAPRVELIVLEDLVEILQGMPLLEILELSWVLPGVFGLRFPEKREDIASLAHLRKLTLEGTSLQCVQMMQHLECPTTTQMKISCGAHYKREELPLLASAIEAKLRGPKDTPGVHQILRCASVVAGPSHFMAWASPHSIKQIADEAETMPPPLLSITLNHPQNVFTSLCALLPLTDVQTLYLNPGNAMAPPKHAWAAPLRKMSNIRELGIGKWADEGQPFPEVLSACVPCPGGPVYRGQPVALSVLPALDAILFKGVYFYANRGVNDMESYYCEMSEVRHRLARPIKRVILRSPVNLDEDDVEWIEDVAQEEFDWDPKDVVVVEDMLRSRAMLLDDFGSGDFDKYEDGVFDGPEWNGMCSILFFALLAR